MEVGCRITDGCGCRSQRAKLDLDDSKFCFVNRGYLYHGSVPHPPETTAIRNHEAICYTPIRKCAVGARSLSAVGYRTDFLHPVAEWHSTRLCGRPWRYIATLCTPL